MAPQTITFAEALNEAHRLEMTRDAGVIVFGGKRDQQLEGCHEGVEGGVRQGAG